MATEAHNKAIVGQWFASFWGKICNLDIVDNLAASDVLLQYTADHPLQGREAVKIFILGLRLAFPDFNLRPVGEMVADHDIVMVHWEATGTHTGPAFDDFNIGPLPAASGRKIALSGHSAVRLKDGTIVEEAVWATERSAKLRAIMGNSAL